MLKLDKGANGKAATASKPPETFYQQIVGAPNPLNPREMVVHAVPGTGIPMRDYFAACALTEMISVKGIYLPDEVAKHAYEIADAMIEARKQPDAKGFPYDDNKL